MTDQTNNLPAGGTERVETSDDDYSGMTDYYDPDDEADESSAVATETDLGADEDTTDENGESAKDQPEEVESPVEVYAETNAKVRLADGSTTTVDQLIQQGMMKQDHTRKTQEIATERKAVRADAERIVSILKNVVDFISPMMPPEPDASLAMRDPNAYVRAKAQREAAVAQLQGLVELADQPKQITDAMSDQERQTSNAEENRRLAERFPDVATEQGRQKFFAKTAEAAQAAGFTMDDLRGVTDHRLFVLAHYAKVGMEAMKAREVAKTKAQAAAPVAPRKPGQPVQVKSNADAMRRLSRSGSIKDALKIDWD